MDFYKNFTGKGSVSVILFDENHNLLLQLRDENAPTAANMWSFFGGGIDEGENPLEAVHREVFEELEYKPENPECILIRKHLKHPNFDTEFIFVEKISEEKKKDLVLHEGKDLGWFSLAQALNLPMVNDKKILLNAVSGFIETYYSKN